MQRSLCVAHEQRRSRPVDTVDLVFNHHKTHRLSLFETVNANSSIVPAKCNVTTTIADRHCCYGAVEYDFRLEHFLEYRHGLGVYFAEEAFAGKADDVFAIVGGVLYFENGQL